MRTDSGLSGVELGLYLHDSPSIETTASNKTSSQLPVSNTTSVLKTARLFKEPHCLSGDNFVSFFIVSHGSRPTARRHVTPKAVQTTEEVATVGIRSCAVIYDPAP
ncbi:hypothetical protein Bbelb_355140 [Branchiostoma belcheri]|nr:hypothetical protein Bbelb_355140 [Branchiostoma belcheri]